MFGISEPFPIILL